MINPKDLQKYNWNDISITKINDGDAIMVILMFPTLQIGTDFFDNILSKNEFKFEVGFTKEDNYYVKIDFTDTDFFLLWDSKMTAKEYPPFTWLVSGTPIYITNGAWDNIKRVEGDQYKYNPDLIPLNETFTSISLEDAVINAFSKSLRVEFIDGTTRAEPSAVILVFDKPQGITAYNDLMDLVSAKSTFLKAEKNNEKIDLTFVDGVADTHIKITGLNFNEDQYDDFKAKQKKGHSFAFILGLDGDKAKLPVIFSVGRSNSLLTLAGFID